MARTTATHISLTGAQSRFAVTPDVRVPRSVFNRSCGRKQTMDGGYLYPVFVDEVLPGDTMRMRATMFGRLATQKFPTMDNGYLDTFWFFVQSRTLWLGSDATDPSISNWEKFNGAQTDPADAAGEGAYTVPVFTAYTPAEESLSDYMGIPLTGANIQHISLPFRAYNKVWNEHFRDQNLQDSVKVDTGNGPDNISDYVLLKRGKRHDYFTGALPWTQKGTAVSIPLGTSAPVVSEGTGIPTFDVGDQTGASIGSPTPGGGTSVEWSSSATADLTAVWNDTALEADLTSAIAPTINELREAFQIQRLLERDARGGTRYPELIWSHFRVRHPDQSWRSEYLGGGRTRFNVNPVAATAVVGKQIGDLSAYATFGTRAHGFTKSFTEHGYVIGLVCAWHDLSYQQGLDRMWSRSTRYDFYWPALSMIGEQPILNKEIFMDGSANDDLVFGYQERYGEYRYKQSSVAGQFRSDHSTPLDTWHWALDFASLPALNATFIEETPHFDRSIATGSDPEFLLDCWFDFRCARVMPTFGVPGMIDHF